MTQPAQSQAVRVVVAVSGSGRTLENFIADSTKDLSLIHI